MILNRIVAQLDFDIDCCQLLHQVEEDERNLVVLDGVLVIADDTDWSGVVGDDLVAVGEPGTEETAALDTDAAPALVTAVEEPVLQEEGGSV